MALTSAAGLVSLLDDKGADVKAFALRRLDDIVDEFWAEISEAVIKIEILHEDTNLIRSNCQVLGVYQDIFRQVV
ncbi:unnamed protein product [Heterobilharzia americana]|nr:unnamed protein product [Heterobilharzia americana]